MKCGVIAHLYKKADGTPSACMGGVPSCLLCYKFSNKNLR